MRLVRIAFAFVVLASSLRAEELECERCATTFDDADAAYFGSRVFCGEFCRDSFRREYQDRLWRCKVCDKKVAVAAQVQRRHGYVIADYSSSSWDGYCNKCRDAIRRSKAAAGGALGPSNIIEKFGEDSEAEDSRLAAVAPETIPWQEPEEEGLPIGWYITACVTAGYILFRLTR